MHEGLEAIKTRQVDSNLSGWISWNGELVYWCIGVLVYRFV